MTWIMPKSYASLPSWERGLKSNGITLNAVDIIVAPFVGAWIEIIVETGIAVYTYVAPFVGAWIEIVLAVATGVTSACRSLRGSVD